MESPSLKRLMARDDVHYVRGPPCRYGLNLPGHGTSEKEGASPPFVRRTSSFLTRLPNLAKRLDENCRRRNEHRDIHRKTSLVSCISKIDADHSASFVCMVLTELANQLRKDGDLGTFEAELGGPVPSQPAVPDIWKDLLAEDGGVWDGVSG